MNSCSNLIVLSTLACQLAECLSDEEISVLSADLLVLSDMLANILARKNACEACNVHSCDHDAASDSTI